MLTARCSTTRSPNPEIAEALFVSRNTVKSYMQNVLQSSEPATGSRPSARPVISGCCEADTGTLG